jgi:pimeloyl-ACP methyl ester carboxylesterase
VTEKVNVWHGMRFSRQFLWNDVLNTNLAEKVTRVDVPVYFFIGQHDLTTVPSLSREFFDSIKAPMKAFYTFDASAHCPLLRSPSERSIFC